MKSDEEINAMSEEEFAQFMANEKVRIAEVMKNHKSWFNWSKKFKVGDWVWFHTEHGDCEGMVVDVLLNHYTSLIEHYVIEVYTHVDNYLVIRHRPVVFETTSDDIKSDLPDDFKQKETQRIITEKQQEKQILFDKMRAALYNTVLDLDGARHIVTGERYPISDRDADKIIENILNEVQRRK